VHYVGHYTVPYLILSTDSNVTEQTFKNVQANKFCNGVVQNYRLSGPHHFLHRKLGGSKNQWKSEATESVKVTGVRHTKPCSLVVMYILSRGRNYIRY
jgi:hypothetical protein